MKTKIYRDEAAEKGLFNVMTVYPDVVPKVIREMKPCHFFSPTAQGLYEKLAFVYRKYGSITEDGLEFISSKLNADERELFSECVVGHFTPSFEVEKFITDVKEAYKKRELQTKLMQGVVDLEDLNSDEFVSRLISESTSVLESSNTVRIPEKAAEYLPEVVAQLELEKDKELLGPSTGIGMLDKYTRGFRAGHYWVIGGYTSYGKTTLAVHLTYNFISTYPKLPICFISVEMGNREILEKLMACGMKCDGFDLRKKLGEKKFGDVCETIENSNLYLYDNLATIDDISSKLSELHIKGSTPKVCFVDFIQNIEAPQLKDQYERISYVTRELQKIAKKYGIHIISLSQMNNETAKQKKASLLGLKGSGAIAHTADAALLIYRDRDAEAESGSEEAPFKVIIDKNRHGRCGTINMGINLATGTLINYLKPEDDDEEL